MFDFNSYSTKSKYCDGSKKLVVGKTKDEPFGVLIEEFVGLKPMMYLIFIYYNSEHKKSKESK